MGKIRRRVMMIGGAITRPMIPMDWGWRQMITEVYVQALEGAGVRLGDVDMVACAYNDRSVVDSSIGPQIADALGIVPKPVVVVSSACAGNGITSTMAWNAIASGRCDIIVSMGFARSDNYDAMESMSPHGNYVDYDYMLGLTHINYNSIRDAYYCDKYHITTEQAAIWAYQCHWYAQRNPLAATYGKEPPSLDYLRSDAPDAARARMATNRGGVASCMVLVGEELARKYTDRPVWFDVAYAFRPPYIGNFFNYPAEGLREYDLGEQPGLIVARNEAYKMAGITADDIDVAQVHDLSAPEGMMAIEALGVCPIGHGGEYVAAGGMGLDSRCPVNTYGGGIAFGHGSVGSDFQAGVLENFWQLRGECAERQVPNATVGVNSSYGTHHSLDAVGVLKRGW